MTSTLPLVSVVVPTRNRPHLLSHAVESLQTQDYPPDRYEILVADDSSDTRTRELCRQIQSHAGVPQFRLVAPGARGINAARNEGVRAAGGELIAFVDDDVDVPPRWLSALVEGYLREGDGGCWGGPVRLRLEGRHPRVCAGCSHDRFGSRLDLDVTEISETRFVIGANMAVARSRFHEVGLFDERLSDWGDELEWQIRLRSQGGTVTYVPDAWLWHRRLQSDLAVKALIRRVFNRAAANAAFSKHVLGLAQHSQLSKVPRSLAHWVRHRCFNGVLVASAYAGRTRGGFSRRYQGRDRTARD